MMKNVLAGSLLLLALLTAVPAANALAPVDASVDCNAKAYDFDGDGIPDFVAAGCNAPVRGCAWVNLDGGQRYCTGRPS